MIFPIQAEEKVVFKAYDIDAKSETEAKEKYEAMVNDGMIEIVETDIISVTVVK